VLTAASADASLEDIRVQQNYHIHKLHVAEQGTKEVSDGNREQNAAS
jgi:hypothetical protein